MGVSIGEELVAVCSDGGAEGPQDKRVEVDGVVPELAFEGQVGISCPEITRGKWWLRG